MVAPDLTRVAAQLSDSDLERVIRHGVRKNGRTTWGMPSSMFYHLSDKDLGSIIAFLRSLPTGHGPEAEVGFGPLGRIEILKNPLYAYAEEIAEGAPWMTEADARGEHGGGRYLALTVCTECHGMALTGAYDGTAPNLAIVAAYSRPAFEKLMTTGVPVGGQKLGLMEMVALGRFSHFTKDEVDALYNYLSARAREPAA
jgi:cytochrome c553